MKIVDLNIQGYRNFDNFHISDTASKGLVILAGQNGTGKSTVLEIVNFLLNSNDINQINEDIATGITSEYTKWEITLLISFSELEYLAKRLYISDPASFPSKEDANKALSSLLIKQKKGFYLKKQVIIHKYLANGHWDRRIYIRSDEKNLEVTNSTPRALQIISDNKLLCAYFKPVENVDIGSGIAGIKPGAYNETLGQILNNPEITNRSLRSSVNIGGLLNHLASKTLWERMSISPADFTEIDKTISSINEWIDPLRIEYDKQLVQDEGKFVFKLHNLKTDKYYPVSYASSGEKQMVGLVSAINYWMREDILRPVLLFDEPDSNLHPEYVSRLSRLLTKFLRFTSDSFSCLIATHSPDLIYWNPQNVYQISPDSKTIEKVSTLSQRVEMLVALGKGFSLSYLVKKVIYVESLEMSRNHIVDAQVYQAIVDPQKEKVVFIPVGNEGTKSKVLKTVNSFNQLLNALQASNEINIFALVDSDNEKSSEEYAIVPPYNCVENLFLFNLSIIQDILELEYDLNLNVEDEVLKIAPSYHENKMILDGKDILTKLYFALSKRNLKLFKELGGYKGFQMKILSRLSINNDELPIEIKNFFKELIS